MILNNLAYTQQWLNELEIHLDWDSIFSGIKSIHNENEAKKCEESLRQICESARDDLLSKIDEMIYHIGEKVRFTISVGVGFDGRWCNFDYNSCLSTSLASLFFFTPL